jgi:hypothetical protein
MASLSVAGPPSARAAPGYALVGPRGARPLRADGAQVNAPLLAPGSGLRVVEERDVGGRRLCRSSGGSWLACAELIAVNPTRFAGVRLDGRTPPLDKLAWVVVDGAPLYRAVQEGRATGLLRRARRLESLVLTGSAPRLPFIETQQGWLRQDQVTTVIAAPAPSMIGAHERWIDIDRARQTLVAFEGSTPRLATLVSTGVGSPGSPIETPVGLFPLYAKLREATMTNHGHTGVVPYRYEAVPHVQYFTGSMALHATLWHDRLGRPASHGCINLSPADAAWLFDFTSPALDAAQSERRSTSDSPGTLVRVR